MSCYICENLEAGDTLYASSDWDGGLGFDYIRDIQYCPVCGRKLAEQTENSSEKPNNCDEPQYDFGEYADRLWKIAYERGKREALEQTEPNISCSTCGYSQQTPSCDTCEGYSNWYALDTCDECIFVKGSRWCDNCDSTPKGLDALPNSRKAEQTESQTNGYQTFNGTSVYVSRFEDEPNCSEKPNNCDEPQTDCAWGKDG